MTSGSKQRLYSCQFDEVLRIHCSTALSVLSITFVSLALKSLAMRAVGELKCVVRGEKEIVGFAEKGIECFQEPSCFVRAYQSWFWLGDDC